MIGKRYRQRLVALLNGQLRLFHSTARALSREFKNMEEVKDSVASIDGLVAMVKEQHAAVLEVIERAKSLSASPNVGPEFFNLTGPNGTYEFLSSKRKMTEHIGDMDEWNKVLAASLKMRKGIDKNDKKAVEEYAVMSWRLSAFQIQIHALARLAQGITLLQEAIFRSYGLKFWQDHKRHLRWEGGGF